MKYATSEGGDQDNGMRILYCVLCGKDDKQEHW